MRRPPGQPKLEVRCYVERIDDTMMSVICEAVSEAKSFRHFGGGSIFLYGAGVYMLVPTSSSRWSNYDAARDYLVQRLTKDWHCRLIRFAEINQLGHVERLPRDQWMCSGRRVIATPAGAAQG